MCALALSLQVVAAQQVLKGHIPPVTKKLKSLRRLDAGTKLDLAIGLPLRNREQLTNLLEELYQPSSTNFRHYLKPDEFASSFGPNSNLAGRNALWRLKAGAQQQHLVRK